MDEYLEAVTIVHLGYISAENFAKRHCFKYHSIPANVLGLFESRRTREYYFRPGYIEIRYCAHIIDIITLMSPEVFDYFHKTFPEVFGGLRIYKPISYSTTNYTCYCKRIGTLYNYNDNCGKDHFEEKLVERHFTAEFKKRKEMLVIKPRPSREIVI